MTSRGTENPWLPAASLPPSPDMGRGASPEGSLIPLPVVVKLSTRMALRGGDSGVASLLVRGLPEKSCPQDAKPQSSCQGSGLRERGTREPVLERESPWEREQMCHSALPRCSPHVPPPPSLPTFVLSFLLPGLISTAICLRHLPILNGRLNAPQKPSAPAPAQ